MISPIGIIMVPLKRIKLSNLTIHCTEAQVFISKIKASVSHVYAYEAEGLL